VHSPFPTIKGDYSYYNTLNSESYVVENPDAIIPADERAFTILRYSENNFSAGILYRGNQYNTCILGFPIESLRGQDERERLIKQITDAFK
jgi:serine/threonine-protein kinase RIO1